MSGIVVFSHGLEGDPWGAKIVAMAEVARAHGLSVESIDYRGMNDPAARVERMLEACKSLPGKLVLVGSGVPAWDWTEEMRDYFAAEEAAIDAGEIRATRVQVVGQRP